MIIPYEYHSFPEDHCGDGKAKKGSNKFFALTTGQAQENCNEGNNGFTDIEPGLNHDKWIIIHVIELIIFVIELIGLKNVIVLASFKCVWAIDDKESIKTDNDITDKDPEEDAFRNKHVELMWVNNIMYHHTILSFQVIIFIWACLGLPNKYLLLLLQAAQKVNNSIIDLVEREINNSRLDVPDQ